MPPVRKKRRKVLPGTPLPLGAQADGRGVNFAVYAGSARRVQLCLLDGDQEERLELFDARDGIWYGYVPDVAPGQHYGYRVHAPWAPERGLRGNPHKLLLDPYAHGISGDLRGVWPPLPYARGSDGMEISRVDSASFVPHAVVTDDRFDWGGDKPLRRPLDEHVIYEAHVKGFSMTNREVPEGLRGTYAGLGHRASTGYLRALGVTAVELLPVHAYLSEPHLAPMGLRNYWGYNTLGFFAPHAAYATRSARRAPSAVAREFKTMVKALHASGLAVILDVVYNHTAEGNHLGPMLSLKGFDNPTYYRLVPDNPAYYANPTGTGNALNLHHPQTLQLVMDSLRYWVTDFHIDGFRFDLAVTLARGAEGFDPRSAFLTAVHQDPVLRDCMLIAEPWDIGDGGYRVGEFPAPWSEWNGRYRDTMRDFWRSTPGTLGDTAARLAGSADLYQGAGRPPNASVNFVTVHDGFTLRDLVSYNGKHNEANGEENRDGSDDNRSWNLGAEGATDDPEIIALRARQMRNFIGTLAVSSGVPMFAAGDESGRTQGGNNNAYAQDNPVSWMNWSDLDRDLIAFTQRALELRRTLSVLRPSRWSSRDGRGAVVMEWLHPDGHTLAEEDWRNPDLRACQRLSTAADGSEGGVLLLLNASLDPVVFRLPDGAWSVVLDSATPSGAPDSSFAADRTPEEIERPKLSLILLTRSPSAAPLER